MRAQDYLNKREQQINELREQMFEAIKLHLTALKNEKDLQPKDRIELIGRILPFIINKLAADKEVKKPNAQGDPLAALAHS